MADVRLHPLAEADLDEIIFYTTQNRGEDQARLYASALSATISDAARNPSKGRIVSRRMPGLKFLKSGRHFVCVLHQDQGPMLVVGFLHERMNIITRIRNRLNEIESRK